MTIEQFLAVLRTMGFTPYRTFAGSEKKRLILQSRTRDNFPSIADPDSLSSEERAQEIERFRRLWDG